MGYDGPSRGILGQAKYTDRNKFRIIIGEIKSTRHPALVKSFVDKGYEHISLNSNKIYDLSLVLKLVILLKKKRIDLLNTHNALACWYGNIAAKIVRIPVIFTLRNNQRENYKLLLKNKILYEAARQLDRFAMRIADKTVAVSKRLEQFYIEHEGIPKEKIATINNAIDLEPIEKFRNNNDRNCIRKKMGIESDTVVIGIVGDLVERKGHACLIEAARMIVKEQNDVAFLIVGDGPLKDDLKSQISECSISSYFVFTGHVKNVFQYLMSMDIFVLPSFAEGISRALMESMAMGVPSVCSAIDGNLEAVDVGETGFIFPVNDSESLSNSLISLIGNPDLRKEMGAKALIKARGKFDMKILAGAYEELYEALAGNYAHNS